MKINPADDGVTHINVYSQGKTQLGRFLSNFTNARIQTEDGVFNSIEGYWYWLNTSPSNPRRDELRSASGFFAKKLGRALGAPDYRYQGDFQRKILAAIKVKIESNQQMLSLLKNRKLPLKHYYVFGSVVKEDPRSQWMLDFMETYKE